MAALSFRIESDQPVLKGWRYLWCKTVRGFNPGIHCARCLVGEYDNAFGRNAPVNKTVALTHEQGTILYFCGVANPYKWDNNAHLAGRVKAGAVSRLALYNGDVLIVDGLEAIPIAAKPAEALFPQKDASFLTCRNFQFGAQVFMAEAVDA